MVYSGSLVTYGRASAVVVGTGMNTEIGKIAQLLNQTQQRKTPLQVSLDNFSKKLAIMIMIVSAVVFGLSIYNKMGLLDATKMKNVRFVKDLDEIKEILAK